MPYDLPPEAAELAPGDPCEGEAWETWCRRLIWSIATTCFLLLVALPLIEYLRYGMFPHWVTEDVMDLPWRPNSIGLLWGAWTLLSTLLLMMTALCGLFYYVTVAKVSPMYSQHRLFWPLSALGFLWLAGDEFFGFHEYIRLRLQPLGLPRPPIGTLGDVVNPGVPMVIGLIAIIGLRKAVLPHKSRWPLIYASVAFLAISTILDVSRPQGHRLGKIVEDGTKILAVSGLFLFYFSAYLDAIGKLLQQGGMRRPSP